MNKIKTSEIKNKISENRRLAFSVIVFLLVTLSFLGYTVSDLYIDKTNEEMYWNKYLTENQDLKEEATEKYKDAVNVKVGTYIENIKEVNIKNSTFTVDMMIWFRWTGDKNLDMKSNYRIYKGKINSQDLVKETTKGKVNYQLLRINTTVSKTFWTPRFPLESHLLRIYIESNYSRDKVNFINEGETEINPNLQISGYYCSRIDSTTIVNVYDQTRGDPDYKGEVWTSEHMTQFELKRDGFGTYVKCFIALLGTSLWVFIVLYINTKHRVDPLGMIPAALFGTVTNIMVGANLVPDALQIGLLEYVNIWGIFTILFVTFSVINVNRIRNKYNDKEYAAKYGQIMFWLIMITIIIGHILLPLSAYNF